jgi:hypothetical protein
MRIAVMLLLSLFPCLAASQALMSEPEAMRSMYGEYDPATKTASGMLWSGPEDGVKRVYISVLLFATVAIDGVPTSYVLTSAVPAETSMGPYECHLCAPMIGFAVFHYVGSEWRPVAENRKVEKLGAWGHPPDVFFQKIGQDDYGVMLVQDDDGQGFSSTHGFLLGVFGSSVHQLWDGYLGENDSGAYDPKDKMGIHELTYVDVAYRFVLIDANLANQPVLYDLELVSHGYGHGEDDLVPLRHQDWEKLFRFEDGRYKLISQTKFGKNS